MQKLSILQRYKVKHWEKIISSGKRDLANELPRSFWSNPDESYVEFFIKQGANPLANIALDAKPLPEYRNPIHEVAAFNPNSNVLRELISYAGSFDYFDTMIGQLPIGCVMANNRHAPKRELFPDNAKVLIDFGTNLACSFQPLQTSAIHMAVTAPEDFEFVLSQCLAVKTALEAAWGNDVVVNQTPLACAAGAGRLWACKKLVENGADVEGRNGDISPLTACVSALTTPYRDFRYDDDLILCAEYLINCGAQKHVFHKGIACDTRGWIERITVEEARSQVESLFFH